MTTRTLDDATTGRIARAVREAGYPVHATALHAAGGIVPSDVSVRGERAVVRLRHARAAEGAAGAVVVEVLLDGASQRVRF